MSDPFDTFETIAFRVEALPHYRNTDGSDSSGFIAWLEGKPQDPNFNQEWVEVIAAAKQRGAIVRRLRLVSTKLTDYERYELSSGYMRGRAAGEEIRVLGVDAAPGIQDAWYFDGTAILEQHYGSAGEFRESKFRILNEEDKATLQKLQDLYATGVPLEEFLSLGGK